MSVANLALRAEQKRTRTAWAATLIGIVVFVVVLVLSAGPLSAAPRLQDPSPEATASGQTTRPKRKQRRSGLSNSRETRRKRKSRPARGQPSTTEHPAAPTPRKGPGDANKNTPSPSPEPSGSSANLAGIEVVVIPVVIEEKAEEGKRPLTGAVVDELQAAGLQTRLAEPEQPSSASQQSCEEPGCLVDLCKAVAARYLAAASVVVGPNRYTARVSLADAEQGEVVAAASRTCALVDPCPPMNRVISALTVACLDSAAPAIQKRQAEAAAKKIAEQEAKLNALDEAAALAPQSTTASDRSELVAAWVPWTVGAVGAGLLSTGVYLIAKPRVCTERLDREAFPEGQQPVDNCLVRENRTTAGVLATSGGLLALGTGVVLYWLNNKAAVESKTPSSRALSWHSVVRLVPQLDWQGIPAGLSLRGRF